MTPFHENFMFTFGFLSKLVKDLSLLLEENGIFFF